MKTLTAVKALFILLTIMSLSACSVTPEEYRNESPKMDMKTYFNGSLQAWGIFQNYREKVVKRFHVNMIGKWEDDKGILDEHFTYSDGATERRVWNLVRIDQHNYTGTADDVVGEARGTAYGNALRWQYTLSLQVDDESYHVQFDDWMFRMDDNTVINRSVMSKFGIEIGEVILFFQKHGPDTSHSQQPSVDNAATRIPHSDMPLLDEVNRAPSFIL